MNSPSERLDLAVIVVAKDEADNLLTLIPALKETLRALSCRSEILVADGRRCPLSAGSSAGS